jgi:complement component 1 Q subcomponent-binding protein, mitochondrial
LLTERLGEELKYELEAAASKSAEPEFLKAFKSQGIWTVRQYASI